MRYLQNFYVRQRSRYFSISVCSYQRYFSLEKIISLPLFCEKMFCPNIQLFRQTFFHKKGAKKLFSRGRNTFGKNKRKCRNIWTSGERKNSGGISFFKKG